MKIVRLTPDGSFVFIVYGYPQTGAPDDPSPHQRSERTYRQYAPWQQAPQQHRNVEPDRFGVVVKIRPEAREVLSQDELAEELRIAHLYEHVPGHCCRKEDDNTGNPKRANDELPLALPRGKQNDDQSGESGSYGALSECRNADEAIEERQPRFCFCFCFSCFLRPASCLLAPDHPRQHPRSEERRQRHVRACSASEA